MAQLLFPTENEGNLWKFDSRELIRALQKLVGEFLFKSQLKVNRIRAISLVSRLISQ